MIYHARKKPVTVECLLWTGKNESEVNAFLGDTEHSFRHYVINNDESQQNVCYCLIHTLEGTMVADEGDYIIKGVNGEFYPCKPDIFVKTYDIV